ncbi:MAG: glutamate 5-kinase [Verrucomicrobiia bacterium]
MKLREQLLGKARRIVVKLGTGLLTNAQNQLARAEIERLVGQLAALQRDGREVLVVSSGAIAAGMSTIGLATRPKDLAQLQACAAVGQCRLMAMYDEAFARFGIHVAQILLTHDDLRDRARHLNARHTLDTLLRRGVVPIINENDTVSVDEIKFGDNDRLGALTATLIDADLLVILSHVEGLLDREKRVVTTVPEVSAAIESLAGGTYRGTSVGGMKSKLAAAKIVMRAGIPMVIANGECDNVLADILAGEEIGTVFLPGAEKLAGRKRWIAFFQRTAGALRVDNGARDALCVSSKSLLAKGVINAEGDFVVGDAVSIQDKNGVEFARGLTKVASSELKTAAGVVVHRDDLVIL